jgi:hypothetical protein
MFRPLLYAYDVFACCMECSSSFTSIFLKTFNITRPSLFINRKICQIIFGVSRHFLFNLSSCPSYSIPRPYVYSCGSCVETISHFRMYQKLATRSHLASQNTILKGSVWVSQGIDPPSLKFVPLQTFNSVSVLWPCPSQECNHHAAKKVEENWVESRRS